MAGRRPAHVASRHHEQGARISLAGAQDKTSIAISDDGVPRLPKGTSPSTHILKPNIRRLAKVWHSAANEAIVMRAAALAGLPTAEVFCEPHTEACVVRRFDRQLRADGTLARLVQYDLCQLAGDRAKWSYLLLADELRRRSARPNQDLKELFRHMVFNALISNTDDHPRNHALVAATAQWELPPAYDLTPGPLSSIEKRDLAMSCGRFDRYANRTNILSEHAQFKLSRADATEIIDQIQRVVSARWHAVLRQQGASQGGDANPIDDQQAGLEACTMTGRHGAQGAPFGNRVAQGMPGAAHPPAGRGVDSSRRYPGALQGRRARRPLATASSRVLRLRPGRQPHGAWPRARGRHRQSSRAPCQRC